jgi:hypothetical protein
MQARSIRKTLCLLCLSLAAIAIAQSKTPSVLDRVQRVDDPELGELIRAAMEGREDLGQREKLEVIRKVTQSYAQIRLLDRQIEEVSRKMELATGPAEMRYELLMARTELESKLMTEMTNLREVMGVVPRYPFDKQPVEGLHTSLRLNPIDEDRVYVLDTENPSIEYWAMTRFKFLGLMSQSDVLSLIRGRLSDPNNLPIRVDILWRNKAGEELRDRTIALIREMGAEMQADVRLAANPFIGSGEAPFFLRRGEITTFYPAPVQRPDGPPGESLINGLVAPADIEQHILWRITFQWNVPLTFRIEYDKASSDLARRIADQVATITKRLGVNELVDVNSVLVEPIPEAAFMGRWRAIADGEVREVALQPQGQCELTMDRQPDGSGGSTVMSAEWFPRTKEILIDLKRVYAMGYRYVYRGHINSEGNLVLDKGLIECQGSFGLSSLTPIVLEKVE